MEFPLENTHSCYFFVPNQVVRTFAHCVVRRYNFVWLFPWLCGFYRYIMVTRNIIVQKLQIDFNRSKIVKTKISCKINQNSKFLILSTKPQRLLVSYVCGREIVIMHRITMLFVSRDWYDPKQLFKYLYYCYPMHSKCPTASWSGKHYFTKP